MSELTGNLITMATCGQFDVIVHGCNCFNNMGSGIAVDIKNVFPEAWEADQRTKKGDRAKMGTFTSAFFERNDPRYDLDHQGLTVINAYTQYRYGRGLQVEYESLEQVFKQLGAIYRGTHTNIGFPQIGAGLAGGDWDIIEEIIEDQLEGCVSTLVNFNGVPVTQKEAYKL